MISIIIFTTWRDDKHGKTPEFKVEDAIAVLKKMHEPPTKKDKDFAREIRNQRIVLF